MSENAGMAGARQIASEKLASVLTVKIPGDVIAHWLSKTAESPESGGLYRNLKTGLTRNPQNSKTEAAE